MKYSRLPDTDLEVSGLCLGTMTFGTPVAERDAVEIVHRALELGVNFIDTANMYEGYSRVLGSSGGVAEVFIGRALSGRRQQAVLATKAGNPVGPDPEDQGLSPAHLHRECNRSLARLGTDYVDLFYLHRPDPTTPVADSVGAVADLINAGKVRYWGLSNFDPQETRDVLSACQTNGWPAPVAQQPPYSLLNRAIEDELLPLCRSRGLAVIPYQVLQGGLLTGKYADPRNPPPGSRGAEKPEWLPLLQESDLGERLRTLVEQAQCQGVGLFEYTVLETLAVPGIASIILGVKSAEQLAQVVGFLQS